MKKTQNYNLNKPEAGDPIRVADFNQNSDIIDAALKSLNTAVGTKAEQSAVNALTTAVASAGNCKIATGSYTGTGTYGADNPITLTFDFTPKYIQVLYSDNNNAVTEYYRLTALVGQSAVWIYGDYSNSDARRMSYMTWSGNSVSWYSTASAWHMMNASGETYRYIALG